MKYLTNAEINRLHRLIGWVRCELGQTPEEFVETVKRIGENVDLHTSNNLENPGMVSMLQKYPQTRFL